MSKNRNEKLLLVLLLICICLLAACSIAKPPETTPPTEDPSVTSEPPAQKYTVTVGEKVYEYSPQDTAEKTVENIFSCIAEDSGVAVCTLSAMESYEPQNTRFVEENYQTGGKEIFGKEVPATREYWQENVKLLYAKYLIRFAAGGGTAHYRLLMPMAREDTTGLWYVWKQPEQEAVESGDSVIPHTLIERYEEGKIYYGGEGGWNYDPAETPEQTITYILYGENTKPEILACWERSIEADAQATQEGIKTLAASPEGKEKGYTEESLKGRFQVFQTTYKVFYDREEKGNSVDGIYQTTFSMLQDPQTGMWSVWSSVKPKLLEELEPQPIIPNPHRQPKNPNDEDYSILTATPPEYERATTPEGTARNYIESRSNSYGTVSAEVISLILDEALTNQNRGNLAASERGQKHNFTAEYLINNFAVVDITYRRVRDENVPQFEADGICKSVYHMIRDPETGLWYIFDSLTPYTVNE